MLIRSIVFLYPSHEFRDEFNTLYHNKPTAPGTTYVLVARIIRKVNTANTEAHQMLLSVLLKYTKGLWKIH